MTIEELKEKAKWVRLKVLDMSVKNQSGHITTAMSQCEMLCSLYYAGIIRINPKEPRWPDRDRFILSKGQGGIGTYPILADLGFFPLEELDRFTQKGSILGVHAEWNIPGVELLTGSLGHGLPMATGMALDAKLKGKNHLIFCLLGDGELHEGSNWEAMMFAAHYNLSNLICIVDRNGQSTLGFHDDTKLEFSYTYRKDGPNIGNVAEKFAAFGFDTMTIQDGHNFESILKAFEGVYERPELQLPPLCIVSKTSKGRGTTITENQRLWHYRVPAGKDLEIMQKELEMGLDVFDEYKKTVNSGNSTDTPSGGE